MNDSFIDLTVNNMHDKVTEIYEALHDHDPGPVITLSRELIKMLRDLISDMD